MIIADLFNNYHGYQSLIINYNVKHICLIIIMAIKFY